MSQTTENNKRIAKNTIALYFRSLFILAIGLYTSRVVISTLGFSDYGLYNVVGGIIVLFTFLNNSLTAGTQRFITYALGEGDMVRMKDVFSTAIRFHVLFSLFVFIVAEIVGLLFLYTKLQIPDGRMDAAFWVFQFSVLATIINVIIVPYRATLIAHEKMNIYAYIGIYEAVMKLLIAYLIQISPYDKLIVYAFLLFFVNISILVVSVLYCYRHYIEVRSIGRANKEIGKSIVSYSSWNVFGSLAVVAQGQGLNMLLNMFFGTIVNAARGIVGQVSHSIMLFVANFQTAINPQIVKLYASGNIKEMRTLILNSSKTAAYLFLIIAVPVFVEADFVLTTWLGEYPIYTIEFLRIVIFQSLIQTMSRPIVIGINAVGRIKMPSQTAGYVLLSIIPVSYVLMRLGFDPITIFAVNVIPWILHTLIDLFWLNKYVEFSIWNFYKEVYGRVFVIATLMYGVHTLVHHLMSPINWISFFVVCFVGLVSGVFFVLYIGLSRMQRQHILNYAFSKIRKISVND